LTERGRRGPLWAIVLTASGEDVRQCGECFACEDYFEPGMDLTFGEIFRAVSHDQPQALTNRTLWTCDRLLHNGLHCQNGLDIRAIVGALREEAHLRGIQPDASP
jgi:heterodisulfide reductase subunit C